MTELENKAEEYESNISYCGLLDCLSDELMNSDYGCCSNYITPYITQAYKDGYEQGQKDFQCSLVWKNNGLHEENEELKAQIDKMKCCGNCKHLKGKCSDKLVSYKCDNLNDWELV